VRNSLASSLLYTCQHLRKRRRPQVQLRLKWRLSLHPWCYHLRMLDRCRNMVRRLNTPLPARRILSSCKRKEKECHKVLPQGMLPHESLPSIQRPRYCMVALKQLTIINRDHPHQGHLYCQTMAVHCIQAGPSWLTHLRPSRGDCLKQAITLKPCQQPVRQPTRAGLTKPSSRCT
jgi:hypothetical protein